MELGEKRLVVQRASVGAKQGDMHTSGGGGGGHNNTGGASGNVSLPFVPSAVTDEEATRVLQLMNMVTPDELEDDEEYQGNILIVKNVYMRLSVLNINIYFTKWILLFNFVH